MANDSIDKLARLLAETLPQNLRSARDELEQNFRAVLKSSLARLDLVTREEFEVQEAVLARTRKLLEDMDARLAAMEAAPASKKKAKKKPKKKAKRKASKKKSGKKKG